MSAVALTEDRSAEVTAFAEHARWDGQHDGYRTGWLAARAKLVTASRVASLLGLSPWGDALTVYADLVAPPPPEPEGPIDLNSPLVWGKALERAVAETAAAAHAWELRMSGKLLTSRAFPMLGATLDAEIKVDGEWCVYEGKTWDAMKRRDWDEETGKAPEHVLIQCHAQLIVTGAPRNFACALIGGNKFAKVEVLPHAELHDFIKDRVSDLFARVARLDPPPPTWRSEDAIRQLYPHESGETIPFTHEQAEWVREAQNLAAARIMSEKREKELKNLIRLTLGEASFAELPEDVGGKRYVKCVTETREAHSVAGSSGRVVRFVKSKFGKAEPQPSKVTVLASTAAPDEGEIGNVVRFGRRRRASR